MEHGKAKVNITGKLFTFNVWTNIIIISGIAGQVLILTKNYAINMISNKFTTSFYRYTRGLGGFDNGEYSIFCEQFKNHYSWYHHKYSCSNRFNTYQELEIELNKDNSQ